MAKFQPGKSGNSRGRPVGAVGKTKGAKDFKRSLVSVSSEALNNLVTLMRNSKKLNDEVNAQIDLLDKEIKHLQDMGEEGSPEELRELLKEKTQLLRSAVDVGSDTAKYSIKILDYVYNIVIHDDELEIKRHRAQMTTPEVDEDEDDSPVISTVPLKAVK